MDKFTKIQRITFKRNLWMILINTIRIVFYIIKLLTVLKSKK